MLGVPAVIRPAPFLFESRWIAHGTPLLDLRRDLLTRKVSRLGYEANPACDNIEPVDGCWLGVERVS